jgi:aquaporin related protein
MPRIPGAYRDPKPPPRRSRSQHSEHELRNGNASSRARRESDYDVPAPEPKKRISTMEGHLVAASGEFVGTFMFLFFCFSGQLMITNQASERSILNGGTSSQQNIFTALLYGFSLLVNVWAFFRISGGLFNPAVCVSHSSQVVDVGVRC